VNQNAEKIKISIIEDSKIHCEWLKLELRSDETLEIVSSDNLGRQGIESVKKHKPHLILLDFQLQDMTGLEVIKRVKSHHPTVKIFMITAHTESSLIARICQDKQIDALGIKGSRYFEENFLTAVHDIVNNGAYLDPILMKKLREYKNSKGLNFLTKREFEIFVQLNIGKTDFEIAHDLCVEIAYIRNLKSKIAKKMKNVDLDSLLSKLLNNTMPDLNYV
jgi:DNA-binding NarL/FixJ family response regulator